MRANRILSCVSLFGVLSQSLVGLGLPDRSLGDPYSRFGIQNSAAGGAPAFLDENQETLYVGPKNRQVQQGVFSFVGGVVDCGDLADLRSVTYAMPKTDEVQSVIDAGRAFSPAFDSTFGIYARNSNLVEKIVQLRLKTTQFLEQHKDLYSAFQRDKTIKDLADAEVNALELRSQTAEATFNKKITFASDEPDADVRKNLMKQAREDYKIAVKEVALLMADASQRRLDAYLAYAKSKGEWAPYGDQYETLNQAETSLTQSYATLQALADSSLARSQNLIKTLESKVVGSADASYNIVSDEVNLIKQSLGSSGSHLSVSPLQIFNVRLSGSIQKLTTERKDTVNGFEHQMVTVSFPEETVMSLGSKAAMTSGFTAPTTGKPLNLLFGEPLVGNTAAAGSFVAPVTQGGYCGAATEKLASFRSVDKDGKVTSADSRYYEYNTPQGNVFTQSVGLDYNFYSKATPMGGSCSMNVSRTSDYWRSSGSQKSWSLTGGSQSRSWDDTKTSLEKETGIICRLTLRPSGANPEEARDAAEAFEKSMYNDMMAMFLLEFAKSYDVKINEVPKPDAPNKPLATAGNAVLSICGSSNVYCAVAGVVLKTVDEMVGSRAQGSTSSAVEVSGTISKDFIKDSYYVDRGSASIDIQVKADNR